MTDTIDTTNQPPEHRLMASLVKEQDWSAAVSEWEQASEAASAALTRLTWPAPSPANLDRWLDAVDRQTIAKTRLVALCELQWQKP